MKTIKLILFYLASFTWGAVMSVIGLLAGLALTIAGHKPHVFHGRLYWIVGESWGGVELGCFFICSKDSDVSVMQHEAGHGLQNIILGPFFPFIVGIPSALRYWLREMKTQKDKYLFGFIVWIIGTTIGFILSILAAAHGTLGWNWGGHWPMIVDILGKVFLVYGAYLGCWLMFFETPKYVDNKYVPYDNFWPEGWATRWGEKYFAE